MHQSSVPSSGLSMVLLTLLVVCAGCPPLAAGLRGNGSGSGKGAAPAADPRFIQFDPNIPGIVDAMLDPAYWAARSPDPDRVIMTPDEIARFNRANLRQCEVLKDLRRFRRVVPGDEVRRMIAKVSSRPSKTVYRNGQEVDPTYFDGLERALNASAVPDLVTVRFGVTVKRTEMRAFPTTDQVFGEPDDYEFDKFMETALYPLEPLAILHESADGKWFLAQAYHYLAWVPVADVAVGGRGELFRWLDAEPFLVVTGKHVFTTYNPLRPEISELQLDMGVRIPLAKRDEIPLEIDGQHPAGSWVVKLPARDAAGRLEWRLGLISRADEVRVGFLPLTVRNTMTQAFRFLGQRYGWGGMFNTRDCSAFIMDIFRSMGVCLPRNAGEQGKLSLGVTHAMPKEMPLAERRSLFDRLPPGSPVYMDGHAMLYIGKEAGDYYIIHDFSGFNVPDADGKMKRSKARLVFVTPLLAVFLSSGKPWMEGLYAAREFRLDGPAR